MFFIFKAINKHEALEETKSFTVQSLASVAYQVLYFAFII